MNPALATISCVEPDHALAVSLAVREIQLKNNKLPLSAAPHRSIDHSTSQNHWPLISAISLTVRLVSKFQMLRMRSKSKEVEI